MANFAYPKVTEFGALGRSSAPALSLAPLSMVQAVLAGGAVLLAVLAQRVFGHDVSRRQWLGLFLGGLGLGLLLLTVPRLEDHSSSFSISAMIAFEGGLTLLAA